MTRTSKDRKLLVDFLNKAPPGVEKGPFKPTILSDLYATVVKSAHDKLRWALGDLLAPSAYVPRTWKPASRKKETAFMNYYGPKVGMIRLVEELNKHAEKPRWRWVTKPKRLAKIAVPGFTGTIEKREFSNPVWQAIAKLLESGEIFWISQCPICKEFFAKNREWQKCCPKAACRKTYENQLAADRQARVRRKRKQRKAAQRVI